MRSALFVSCAVIGALSLAACSKKAADTAPAPATPAPVAAAEPAAPAAASGPATSITLEQLPAPKAGLWERVSTQDSDAPQTDKKCMGGKPINPMADGPKCAKVDVSRTATGGFLIDANCPNNGVTAKLHASGEGDFNAAYATDSTMTMSMAGTPDNTMKNHSAYRFLGACPAGQKPEG